MAADRFFFNLGICSPSKILEELHPLKLTLSDEVTDSAAYVVFEENLLATLKKRGVDRCYFQVVEEKGRVTIQLETIDDIIDIDELSVASQFLQERSGDIYFNASLIEISSPINTNKKINYRDEFSRMYPKSMSIVEEKDEVLPKAEDQNLQNEMVKLVLEKVQKGKPPVPLIESRTTGSAGPKPQIADPTANRLFSKSSDYRAQRRRRHQGHQSVAHPYKNKNR